MVYISTSNSRKKSTYGSAAFYNRLIAMEMRCMNLSELGLSPFLRKLSCYNTIKILFRHISMSEVNKRLTPLNKLTRHI